jgi:hypothetical protein
MFDLNLMTHRLYQRETQLRAQYLSLIIIWLDIQCIEEMANIQSDAVLELGVTVHPIVTNPLICLQYSTFSSSNTLSIVRQFQSNAYSHSLRVHVNYILKVF